MSCGPRYFQPLVLARRLRDKAGWAQSLQVAEIVRSTPLGIAWKLST